MTELDRGAAMELTQVIKLLECSPEDFEKQLNTHVK